MSHSSADLAFAERLVRDLDVLGIDVWIDRWDLEPGDHLPVSIGRWIDRSSHFGVVLSPAFLRSDWCQFELERALKKEKRARRRVILPMLIKRAVLPNWASNRVYVDLTGRYFNGLLELAGVLHRIPRRRIADGVGDRRLNSVRMVGKVLQDLGWNGAGLWDAEDFDEIATLDGVIRRGKIIEFVPNDVVAANPKLSSRARRLLTQAAREP